MNFVDIFMFQESLTVLTRALSAAVSCEWNTLPIVQPHMALHSEMEASTKLRIARLAANAANMKRVQANPQAVVKEPAGPVARKVQQQYQYRDENTERTPERVRVGYISADFRLKATSYLVYDLYTRHNRSRIEAYCIATTPDSEADVKHQLKPVESAKTVKRLAGELNVAC